MPRRKNAILSARRRKRVRRAKVYGLWGVAVLVFGLFAFAGVGYLSHLPHFAIAGVSIEGTETVASAGILKTVEDELSGSRVLFFSKRNHLLYPEEAITTTLLDTYPKVGEVGLEIREDNTLLVSITQRQPAFIWCSSEMCRFMDETGVVFADIPSEDTSSRIQSAGLEDTVAVSSSTPAISREMFQIVASSTEPIALGEAPLSGEELERIQTLKRGIEEAGFLTSVFFRKEDGSGVFETAGPDIRVPADSTAQQLIENLLTVTSVLPENKELEYIDLRFGDHVPYYPQQTENEL